MCYCMVQYYDLFLKVFFCFLYNKVLPLMKIENH